MHNPDPRLAGHRVSRIAFTEPVIAQRVKQLGEDITAAYPDGELLLLGLLKGCCIFLSDLVRQILRPLKIDFLVAASYGVGTVSSCDVQLLYDPQMSLHGKHVLVVEDIIDSGHTLEAVMQLLAARRPRSLAICSLLDKRMATQLREEPRFVGFHAPNEFMVGYGLDCAEEFRHLPYIASLA